MTTTSKIDAVDLSIMWNRLISITDEGAAALVRSSFSTLVREGYDLTVLVFDRAGRMIAQSAKCIPVFIGTAPSTLSHMLRKFPAETLVPGDVVISNDPMYGTGHMFDLAVMRPIFEAGVLKGFSMSITHLPDIGGMGFSVSATQIYHEGLRLPILKLYKAGTLDQDVVELIELNVRTPEQVTGDIFASVSCTEVVTKQVIDFMNEYRLETLDELADAILDSTEEAVRAALRAMPDGTFHNQVQVEAHKEARTLVCAITKEGDSVSVDFAGTGPCVGAGINVPFPYTRAMVLYALKCITSPNIPNNEGAMRPIAVTAPLGSILNAIPPAPSAGRHAIGHFIFPLITDTLAEIVPGHIAAASGLIDILTLQGQFRDGSPMAETYFCSGGFGGAKGLDGKATMPGSSNMGRPAIEMFEAQSGLTVLEKSIRPDSGGAGEFVGGAGQTIVMRNDSGHPMTIFAMANRTSFAANGIFGGGSGAPREHWVDDQKMSGQGAYRLEPGSTVTLLQPGGGGFGDPAKRNTERIQEDIAQGFLTTSAAERLYNYRC